MLDWASASGRRGGGGILGTAQSPRSSMPKLPVPRTTFAHPFSPQYVPQLRQNTWSEATKGQATAALWSTHAPLT